MGGYENATLVEPGDIMSFSKAIDKSLSRQMKCQPGGQCDRRCCSSLDGFGKRRWLE